MINSSKAAPKLLKIPTKSANIKFNKIKSLFLNSLLIESQNSCLYSSADADGGTSGFYLKNINTKINIAVENPAYAIIRLEICEVLKSCLLCTKIGGIMKPIAQPTGFATDAIVVAIDRYWGLRVKLTLTYRLSFEPDIRNLSRCVQ